MMTQSFMKSIVTDIATENLAGYTMHIVKCNIGLGRPDGESQSPTVQCKLLSSNEMVRRAKQ